MNRLHPAIVTVFGIILSHPLAAQQLDFSGPFGRTVAPQSEFAGEESAEAAVDRDEADTTAEILVTAAHTEKSAVQILVAPTFVAGDDKDVYALSGGAAFGRNQWVVRYSKIDLDTGANLDQYFAQYKRQVNTHFGVFGFFSRTDTLFRDYGAAGSFQFTLAPSLGAAFNVGYQRRDFDSSTDEDDILTRGGLLWTPTAWLAAALDYEVQNKVNQADSTALELSLYNKFFLGADTDDSVWAGFRLVF